jgi:hypothetical protein
VAQPGDSCGRIVIIGRGALRDKNCRSQSESDQAYEFARVFSHNHISLLKLERSRFALAPHTLLLGRLEILVRNADALSMNRIRGQRVSGTFRMSNQERPDSLKLLNTREGEEL